MGSILAQALLGLEALTFTRSVPLVTLAFAFAALSGALLRSLLPARTIAIDERLLDKAIKLRLIGLTR